MSEETKPDHDAARECRVPIPESLESLELRAFGLRAEVEGGGWTGGETTDDEILKRAVRATFICLAIDRYGQERYPAYMACMIAAYMQIAVNEERKKLADALAAKERAEANLESSEAVAKWNRNAYDRMAGELAEALAAEERAERERDDAIARAERAEREMFRLRSELAQARAKLAAIADLERCNVYGGGGCDMTFERDEGGWWLLAEEVDELLASTETEAGDD